MTPHRNSLAALALGVAVAAVPLAAAYAQASASERVLVPARSAYYSLSRLGFTGAQCRIVPNWDLMIGARTADKKAAFDVLDQLDLRLTVEADGQAHATSRDPGGPRPAQMERGLQQIYGGLEQAMNGLFATWSLFMVGSPLPDAQTPVTMTAEAGGHRLTYKDGVSDVVEDLDSHGAISRIDIRNATYVSIIEPSFDHRPQGMTLSRYVGDYRPTSGSGVVHIDVRLTYQVVNGLIFPGQVGMDTTLDGQPTNIQISFTDCRVDRK